MNAGTDERGWKQLTIIHLSDMHFGQRHFFNPPSAGAASEERTLLWSISKDLQSGAFALGHEFSGPVQSEASGPGSVPRTIFALTGDFNERCTQPEFKQSETFLQGLYDITVFGHKVGPADIFLIPGNHDLKYAEETLADRWGKFILFYQDHNDKRLAQHGKPPLPLDPRSPLALTRIIDQSDEGLVVAEINSCAYVQKGTVDERRGQLEDKAVYELGKQLEAIDPANLRKSIRIALIHHHPVVLPVLYEEDKEYDAVLNSELLFRLLKEHGFHLLLHGHKHTPFTYSYDAVSAWTTDQVQPILVVAGGSAGSTEIPKEDGSRRTYNVISVKWHPAAAQARILIETRGLVTEDRGGRMPDPKWYWKTLRTDDRLLTSSKWEDADGKTVRNWTRNDDRFERARLDETARLRRNFPAIEVLPSLDKDQAYEARVWIEGQISHPDYKPPERVEWSASRTYFPKIHVCERDADPQFRARFSYYGPTLIQTRLFWSDGEALAYIYARFPRGI
ncbi:metallophosphoesterase [Bradyrhizobium sp. USDA 4451]